MSASANGALQVLPPSYLDPMQTKISSKGQVVIPKSVRGRHEWPAGTVLEVEETADGVLLRPSSGGKMLPEQVFGCLKSGVSRKVTLEEMDAAIDKLSKQ